MCQLGKQPREHTHRQILNKFCSDVMIPEPFCTKVKCIDPKTSLEKEEQVSFFLPHLQFAHLAEHYPMFFQDAFSLGKGDLEKFWTGVESTGDPRLTGHPMCLEKHWKQTSIPLFLHGDGVEYHNRDTILVYSWGPMIGDMGSLKQHQLAACYPKSCTNKSTWGPIWEWLRWSFEALGKGFHPTHDPWESPWKRAPSSLEKQVNHFTPSISRHIFLLCWGTRSTFVMFWGCPIGLHTTLVGNAMVRILQDAPPA